MLFDSPTYVLDERYVGFYSLLLVGHFVFQCFVNISQVVLISITPFFYLLLGHRRRVFENRIRLLISER